nr:uncharacterized protein LOC105879470 [Microcebus murinus]
MGRPWERTVDTASHGASVAPGSVAVLPAASGVSWLRWAHLPPLVPPVLLLSRVPHAVARLLSEGHQACPHIGAGRDVPASLPHACPCGCGCGRETHWGDRGWAAHPGGAGSPGWRPAPLLGDRGSPRTVPLCGSIPSPAGVPADAVSPCGQRISSSVIDTSALNPGIPCGKAAGRRAPGRSCGRFVIAPGPLRLPRERRARLCRHVRPRALTGCGTRGPGRDPRPTLTREPGRHPRRATHLAQPVPSRGASGDALVREGDRGGHATLGRPLSLWGGKDSRLSTVGPDAVHGRQLGRVCRVSVSAVPAGSCAHRAHPREGLSSFFIIIILNSMLAGAVVSHAAADAWAPPLRRSPVFTLPGCVASVKSLNRSGAALTGRDTSPTAGAHGPHGGLCRAWTARPRCSPVCRGKHDSTKSSFHLTGSFTRHVNIRIGKHTHICFHDVIFKCSQFYFDK